VAAATLYTVSDAGFFLGTVALLNSLRLMGHSYELVILDCGFTERQRGILRPHCRLIGFDRGLVASPVCLKPFACLDDPSGNVVVVDSDVIFTHPLDSILDAAEAGRICAFAAGYPSRWFAEWQSLFELSSPLRQQTYVNSGFLALSTARWPDLIPAWWTACQTLRTKPFFGEGRGEYADPLLFPDQDALNALLMSEIPEESVDVLPRRAMGFGSVRVHDPQQLRCSCGGQPTIMLHSTGSPKPWNPRLRLAVKKWRPAYTRLLRRVLASPDVTIRLPSDDLPTWLRPGFEGIALERVVSGAQAMRYRTSGMRRSARLAFSHP
jgi:hypothetical protein